MAVTLGPAVLDLYRRFSLYNSPYQAHRYGRAIDLYPEGANAPSPVAGEVVETRTVRAPPKPYAADSDHLIVIDTGERHARILHIRPSVSVGDRVERGESLGCPVRAGFFAPWVPTHLHLGFRPYGVDPVRASGSLPITIDVPLLGLEWGGTGTVVTAGETWARLDAPACPDTERRFAGLGAAGGVLDGGLAHYEGGGVLGGNRSNGSVHLAGARVGQLHGQDVAWDAITVLVNGKLVTGLSLSCAKEDTGVKLVGRDLDLAVGDDVRVSIQRQ